MRHSAIANRLAGLGGAKWKIHTRAKESQRSGRDILMLTIGEPDCATPNEVVDATVASLRAGRSGYADGQGEPELLEALARRYSRTTGRKITRDHVLCLPGTQTALFTAMMGLVGSGDEVLVGDPLYATYEGVIRAADAQMVPVPLLPENGFRLTAESLSQRITPNSRAVLLNSPHNPTGAILSRSEIREIGKLARDHGLWIISDEVYEELIFDGHRFSTPLAEPDLADRTVVVSSISKSHAAAGFRSGWIIAEPDVVQALLPLAETMLFGNQPFIADMTAAVVDEPSPVAGRMRRDYARRANLVADALEGTDLRAHVPQAGMFTLIDVSATGMAGEAYALELLDQHKVAVMPGTSFGSALQNWVRIALTVPDDILREACKEMRYHAESKRSGGA